PVNANAAAAAVAASSETNDASMMPTASVTLLCRASDIALVGGVGRAIFQRGWRDTEFRRHLDRLLGADEPHDGEMMDGVAHAVGDLPLEVRRDHVRFAVAIAHAVGGLDLAATIRIVEVLEIRDHRLGEESRLFEVGFDLATAAAMVVVDEAALP